MQELICRVEVKAKRVAKTKSKTYGQLKNKALAKWIHDIGKEERKGQ
jgi:U3 small nucleolar RNA-associated protein 14